MLTKPPHPSYHHFVLSLQAHEQMLVSNNDSQENVTRFDQAFITQRGRGRNGGRFSSRGSGFNPAARHSSNSRQNFNHNGGGGGGGVNERNFTWKNNNKKEAREEGTITCQICGKFKHSAIECWNRFDHSFQPEDYLPKALAAMSLKQDDDPKLYADSGATTHMLNDPGIWTSDLGHDIHPMWILNFLGQKQFIQTNMTKSLTLSLHPKLKMSLECDMIGGYGVWKEEESGCCR